MNTASLRTPTSFTFETPFLELLKEKAQESHKSLNTYVEGILMDFIQYPKKKDNQAITPELQAKLDKARHNYAEGNYVSCSTTEELHSLLDSL